MKTAPAITLCLCALLLTGCSSTGGTIGGLLPAPKILKGSIHDSVYTARDNFFTIAVPHKEDSREFKFMMLKEQYNEDEAYVSFGPAARDHCIYRVEIGRWTKPQADQILFEDAAAILVEHFKKQLANAYGTDLSELDYQQQGLNGRKTLYWKFRQPVPPGKFARNKNTALTHETYAVDFGHALALVWIQTPDQNNPSMNALSPREFVKSLNVF